MTTNNKEHCSVLTVDDLVDDDLMSLLETMRNTPGLTSMRGSLEDLCALLCNSLQDDDTQRVFFIIRWQDRICGIASLRFEPCYFYSLSTKHVEELADVAELCSLYILPEYRGHHMVKFSMFARLCYIKYISQYSDSDIKYALIKIRPQYTEDGTEPETLASNIDCWGEHEPTPDYELHNGPSCLHNTNFSVHVQARSVQKNAVDHGFQLLGIDAHDNGPYYILPKESFNSVISRLKNECNYIDNFETRSDNECYTKTSFDEQNASRTA
jgi:hypothetical protein